MVSHLLGSRFVLTRVTDSCLPSFTALHYPGLHILAEIVFEIDACTFLFVVL